MSLHTVMQRSAAAATKRFSSTSAAPPVNPLLPKQYQYSFKKEWLSDPSTYPIMVIMATASALAIGMLGWASTNYKGVKVRTEHKNSIIPTYKAAYAPNVSLTEIITRQPVGFYAAGYKSLRHEGLGIDHEEFVRSKEASKKVE